MKVHSSAKYFKILIATGLFIFTTHFQAFSQTYQVNGTAVNNGNGLVRMTTSQASIAQTASAWSTNKIDLNQPFDMSFEMFFGCNKDPLTGGDGMTFTFHNDPRGLNAVGLGGGFLGIGPPSTPQAVSPAISIEFDTFDGTASLGSNEIPEDHIAIDINGDVNNTNNVFAGTSGNVTVQPVIGSRDLEDCSQNANDYYTIRVVWNPTAKTLQLYEEGILTMTYTKDLIADVFSGNSLVYWGFTGATGSASNEQWIAPQGAIIPWECTVGTSCCAPFTVTPTGPTTICNNPITLSVSGSFDSYSWSDGTTGNTTQVSLPGTYTVNVLQLQQPGNISCPGSATFTITPSGPTATLSGGGTFCNSSQTTPLSVALTGSAPWSLVYSIDGVNQPAINGIATSPYVFQGSPTHTYSLVSVADNSGCNSNATGSATVDLYPGIPVGHDDVFTAPGTANLSVDNDGGTYTWYDAPTGGAQVNTGLTFTTPILNTTTTYYVENTSVTNTTPKVVALPGPGNGGPGTNPDDVWMNFKANTNFHFDGITCAVNIPGTPFSDTRLSVSLQDLTDPSIVFPSTEILYTAANGLPQGGITTIHVPLNYTILNGHTYKISYRGKLVSDPNQQGSLQGLVFWNDASGANAYPINKDPEVTLTRPAPQTEAYPGLYNWEISVPSPSSSCGRTPVTAYTCPKAVLSGDASICNDGSTTLLSVELTGRIPFTLIYAIDGVSQAPLTINSTDPNPYKITSAPGAHVYTLISVSNLDCNGTVSGSATVTLTAGAPIGHDDTFTAPGTADLSVDDGGDTYEWYDAPTGGSLVHTGPTYTTGTLNATTTYYVNNASIVNVTPKVVGLPGPGTGGPGTNPDDVWINFLANSNFHFDGITCAVNIPGTPFSDTRLSVALQDLTDPSIVFAPTEILYTAASGLPQGVVTTIHVPLNYTIISGHSYKLSYRGKLVSDPNQQGSLQGLIFWNYATGANVYPITKDAELTLTRPAPQTEAYPGLYNWEISVVSSTPSCGRTPVTAYVCPTAVLSGDAVICDDGTTTTNLSVALTGAAPWALTYAIDGVSQAPITNITTTPYTIASATGAHVYTLVSVSNATSTGCANSASGTATVTLNPDAPIGHDATFLPGDPANLSVDNTGGTFNWFTTATGNTVVNTTSAYSPVLTSTTTFYVQYIDGNGDTSCTRTPVTAYLCPTAVMSGNAVICNDGITTTPLSVALTGSSPWTLTYAIDGVNQTPLTGITTPNPYVITSATGAHVYTLISVTNATSTGCANGTSGTATVTVKPDAPVGHDATFTPPGTAVLSVDDQLGSTYTWYATLNGVTAINTGATYTTPTLTATTTYYVEQTIGGQTSCTRTPVSAIVLVPTAPLFIPNLMTPNDDGKNDRFEILGLPNESALLVYNRWGNAVYQSDNYNNQWAAENISAGVYYYELKLKNGNSYKGWLQIIW